MNSPAFEALRDVSRHTPVSLRIRGVCMTPTLNDTASVLVRARRFYFPGDVLVFRTNAGYLAAHRMLGWRRAAFVTRGDGCDLHDPPVSRQSIIGAVDVRVALHDRLRALFHYAQIIVRRLLR